MLEIDMHPDSILTRLLLFYGVTMPNHPGKWWLHQTLRKVLKANVRGEREVDRGGFHLFLDPSDFEHSDLFWTGKKDTWELHHLQKLLATDSVFLDIGANLGFYSLRLSRTLGRNFKAHAFEPHPLTFARLSRHVEMNGFTGRIQPQRVALSDEMGVAAMSERSDNSGASTLANTGHGIQVQTMTLDHFVQLADLTRIDAMKIDVEGFESRVLRGGRNSILQFRPYIVIEFWAHGLQQAGSSCQEVANELESLAYVLFDPRTESMIRFEGVPIGEDPTNLFCIPKEKL